MQVQHNVDYSEKLFSVKLEDIYDVQSFTYNESDLGAAYSKESTKFTDSFTYNGSDLGAIYSKESTKLRVWSPLATEINVLIFNDGDPEVEHTYQEKFPMKKDIDGTWVVTLFGDYKNKYYLYEATNNNKKALAVDPYAKGVGVNGLRGAIVDLAETDPTGFRTHKKPDFVNPTDAVIYELHIRDLSVDDNSGIKNKGKFLGLIETGTKTSDGVSTGLDHIKDLGVTHIHLLPSYDYKTVDESNPEKNEFNWGYDPLNYNVPEGSYSTNPYDAKVRITEFKQMVQGLHENNIRVVMDVVYNHTYTAEDSNLNLIVPKYYHRTDAEGDFANGSGCGNEIASERLMVRKFIVDSVVYWAKEYSIDGFRFDLMGLHDIETMNIIREELDKIDPTIIMYGEGWTGGTSPLPDEKKALKANTSKLNNHIAVFSDDMRDGIKGSVFNGKEPGYINGRLNKKEDVKFGIVGSVFHSQVDISKVNYSNSFWANAPTQTINYASAHDNLSLWDKFLKTNPNDDNTELIKLNKLSAALILTSQGIPFFQAGEEMARTKGGDENSYKSPDSVNRIDWTRKKEYIELFDYYKGLIALRKQYSSFRLTNANDVQSNIKFITTENGLITYTLKNIDNNDYKLYLLMFNATTGEKVFSISDGVEFDVLVNEDTAGSTVINTITNEIKMKPKSAFVFGVKTEQFEIKKVDANVEAKAETELAKTLEYDSNDIGTKNRDIALKIILGTGIVIVIGVIATYRFLKRK